MEYKEYFVLLQLTFCQDEADWVNVILVTTDELKARCELLSHAQHYAEQESCKLDLCRMPYEAIVKNDDGCIQSRFELHYYSQEYQLIMDK